MLQWYNVIMFESCWFDCFISSGKIFLILIGNPTFKFLANEHLTQYDAQRDLFLWHACYSPPIECQLFLYSLITLMFIYYIVTQFLSIFIIFNIYSLNLSLSEFGTINEFSRLNFLIIPKTVLMFTPSRVILRAVEANKCSFKIRVKL